MTRKQFDESECRHPLERPIFIGSVIFNLLLMAGAILLIWYGADWLQDHPLIRGSAKQLRALAIAAVFAPPAIAVIRNLRHGRLRGNSVMLSRQQVPEIYDVLEGHCQKLGLENVPILYLTDKAVAAPAEAFSTWACDFIGLNARFIERKPKKSRDVLSFLLGSELGRLRQGHTKWWYEMLLAYVIKIPVLRNPMLQVQILSHDRYGAFLEPNFLPGLFILAAGRRLLGTLDIAECLEHAKAYGGFWAAASDLLEVKPHIYYRIQALVKAGLLDPEVEALKAESLSVEAKPAKAPKSQKKKHKGQEPATQPSLEPSEVAADIVAPASSMADPTKG